MVNSQKSSEDTVHPRYAPDVRREQIIHKAAHMIAENGFWGFSLRSLAQACEVTEPALVYHFKSKTKLLIAVLEYRDHVDIEQFAKNLGVTYDDIYRQDIQFGLVEMTAALVRRNAQQLPMVQMYTNLQSEALAEHHPAHNFFERRERRVLDMFTKAARFDNISDPEREALLTLAVMDGLQIRWLHNPENIDICAEWDAYSLSRWGRMQSYEEDL